MLLGKLLCLLQFNGQQLADAVVPHGHAVKHVGLDHSFAVVGNG